MIQINRAPVYTTSDGKTFIDRKDAVAHEKYLTRVKNLGAIEGIDTGLAEFIASNAADILAAIDVKETRKKAVTA